MRLALYLDDGLICGGAENVARRLLAHWAAQGHDAFLVARETSEDSFYPLPPGVTAVPLFQRAPPSASAAAPAKGSSRASILRRHLPFRSLLRLMYEALLLRRVLARLDIDMAIAFLTPANVKLLIASSGLRHRTLISERSDTRTYVYPSMWTRLRRWLYRRATLVTANLPQSIDDMKGYVPANKLRLVPNPVDLPDPDALAHAEANQRILAVGRLVPYKRHATLIRAFARLGDEFSQWQLDIVGDGPLRDELVRTARELGVAERVHLHGRQGDMSSFYRRAALFVLPSAVEGTSNALLEAMAHALPCVVSDAVASAAHCFDDGISGHLFRFDDVSDLAEKITGLARQPALRSSVGQAARARMTAGDASSAYALWDEAVLDVGRTA